MIAATASLGPGIGPSRPGAALAAAAVRDEAPVLSAGAPEAAAAQVPATAIASYFGPGLYGNRTACGQTLTTDLLGVAHRTLPCGSLVTLRYGASTVTVPVVDRGPFVHAREFDLAYATKVRLGCSDICVLEWLR